MKLLLTFIIGFLAGAFAINSKPPQQVEIIKEEWIDLEGEDIVGHVKIDDCDYFVVHSNSCSNPLHIEINDTIPDNTKLYTKK